MTATLSTFFITVFILMGTNGKTQENRKPNNPKNNPVVPQQDTKPKAPEEKPGDRVE